MDTDDSLELDESYPEGSDFEDARDNVGGPWSRVRFSVRKALDGTFFRPVSTNEEELRQQIDAKSIKVICLKCPSSVPVKTKELKAATLTNSNLFTHLKRHHDTATLQNFKILLESAREEFVALNPHRVNKTRFRKLSILPSLQSKFEELIVNYIIHAMIPLQSIDDPTFKRIFEFLRIENKGLTLISRRTLVQRIDELFCKQINKIRETLSSIPWVCTTADIWSGGRRSFMGVTAHWIDEDNKRISVALACKHFKGEHTHDRIASMLQGIHEEFGLTCSKVVATVTDNGRNFVKAFEVFGIHPDNGGDSPDEDIGEEENWITVDDADLVSLPVHLRCAAHTLALSASSDVIKTIKTIPGLWNFHKRAIEKCNILWKMSNRPKTAEIIQSVLGKSIKRPTDTRWNSLYDSLKEILDSRRFMVELQAKLNIPQLQCLGDDDFRYIEEYLTCSEPVALAIDLLQGETEAYYGVMLPTILALKKKLNKLLTSEFQICLPIANTYLQSIEERFGQLLNVNNPHANNAALAALSYPKFKNRWFPCVDKDVQDGYLNYFKCHIMDYLGKTYDGNAVSEELGTNPPSEDFYDFGEENITEPSPPQNNISSMAETIMGKYLTDKRCSLDVLKCYPAVLHIFKKFNTPLPSSAHVERLFSYATMTNTPKCNRLSSKNFERRVILRANAKLTL